MIALCGASRGPEVAFQLFEVVISKNEKRRKHLTPKQKAFAGARMVNLGRGGDGSNQYRRANSPNGDLANSVSISRACKIIGASELR